MTTTDYQKQAKDFLQATGTTLTVTFKHSGSMAWDEKGESRDIFTCTLKNDRSRYRFTFGQSIFNSTGNGSNPPNAYDVLACIEKYEVEDFEWWCKELGYDNDSRKAYKTYKAVKREWENVKRLFTPEQIEVLQEIN